MRQINRWMQRNCVMTIFVFSGFMPFLTYANSDPTFIDYMRRATVFITTFASTGQKSYATGVLARNHHDDRLVYLITNKHIFSNKIEILIELELISHDEQDHKIVVKGIGRYAIRDADSTEMWKVDETDPLSDVAILEIDLNHVMVTKGKGPFFYSYLRPEEFAEDDYIHEGEHVYYIGFPLRIHGSTVPRAIIREGILASKYGKELKYLFPPNKVQDVYIIESFGLKGSSGSPVILCPFTDVSLTSFPKASKFIGITSGVRIHHEIVDTLMTIMPTESLKVLYNLPDSIVCSVKLPLSVNTGLYLVIPARKIKKLLGTLDENWIDR